MGDIVTDWTSFKDYLTTNTSLTSDQVQDLYGQVFSMDIISLMFLQTNFAQDFSCNATVLERYMDLNSNPLPVNVSLKALADILCSSPETLAVLIKNLQMDDILDLISVSYNLNPNNLVTASNMTMQEFDFLQNVWSDFADIYDDLEKSMTLLMEDLDLEGAKEQMNITEINRESMAELINHYTCGEPLRPDNIVVKPLNPIDNDSDSSKPGPTDACGIIYEQLEGSYAGRAIWRYMQPFIRGNIYLTPVNELTEGIKLKSQWFFDTIEEFRTKVNGITINNEFYLKPENYKSQFGILTELLFSQFFLDFKASNAGDMYTLSELKPINLTEGIDILMKNSEVIEFGHKISVALGCINTQRFKLIESEHELLEAAKEDREKFLAGVVILNSSTEADTRSKRQASSLAEHIQYKIRMEVDSVPITSQIKERLWVPGPDGDFFYNMRYFWGFLQVQDFVDSAIIELHTGEKPTDEVLLQQFPYPCFLRNNYLSGLFTAQMIQVALIFGYSAIISTFVREYAWERESKNGQIIQVMGMKSYVMWTSNIIIMCGIFTFNSLLLSVLMSVGQILPKTSFEIVFITLLAYSTSVAAFVYMLSVTVKKATSGSVVTFLLFIMAFLPFLILVSLDGEISSVVKGLSALFMNSSLGFCFLYITRYEQQQVGMSWENIGISPIDGDSFTWMHYMLFLLLDTFIYGMIGLVISNLSNIDGSWMSSKSEKIITDPKSEQSSDTTTEGIKLVSLTKEFRLGRRNRRVAVDGLSMTFAKNEITGLLGHNGAGKSTTLSMLTGILQPSRGNIVVDGIIFSDQWEQYRKIVGFCPQQSILYENLNTIEHIRLYASLKCKDKNDVEKTSKNLLKKMNLEDKIFTPSKHLSEGLKRRLSIALAFAGDSSIVILDEPTAGVDAAARRHIWDFISDCKENKTIIITTHYMDEAESLCDNIAIIHKGKLLHHGPTIHLQNEHGSGLQLNISMGINSQNPTEVTSVSSSRASIEHSNPNSDPIDKHVNHIVPTAKKVTHSATRRSYALPVEEEKDYQNYHALFAVLENEKQILDISTFSIASPNLEDIFLSMTLEADSDMKENIRPKRPLLDENSVGTESEVSSMFDSESNFQEDLIVHSKKTGHFLGMVQGLFYKRAKRFTGDKKLIMSSVIVPTILLALSMTMGKIRPNTTSPPILLTPSIYGPESLSFLSNLDDGKVSVSLLNSPGIGTTCMDNFESIVDYTKCSQNETGFDEVEYNLNCSCDKDNWECSTSAEGYNVPKQLTNTTDIVNFLPTNVHPNKWILDTHYDLLTKQYGGWRFVNETNIVYYNNKGFHSSAAYFNTLNNARLRSKFTEDSKKYGISTYSHPFRSTTGQVLGQSILQHVSDYTLALLMLAVASFVPSGSIISLIQERKNEEKLVLKTFQIGPGIYWIVTFAWDICVTLLFVIIAAALLQIFGVRSFSHGLNYPATLLLFLTYCLNINCFIYLAEKLFNEPSFGQVLVFTTCVFSGVFTLIIMMLCQMYWWIKPLAAAREVLITLLLMIPPYALGKFLNQICNLCFCFVYNFLN